jgi:Regulator of chromosome condensation (RCC1) repeat
MTQVADCLPKPSAHIPAAPAMYQDRLSGVKQVAAGQNFTVALRSNGEVWTGGPTTTGSSATVPTPTAPGRPATFYGPGTGLTGAVMAELIRKRRYPIVGGGRGVWSMAHITDAASATVAAIEGGKPAPARFGQRSQYCLRPSRFVVALRRFAHPQPRAGNRGLLRRAPRAAIRSPGPGLPGCAVHATRSRTLRVRPRPAPARHPGIRRVAPRGRTGYARA